MAFLAEGIYARGAPHPNGTRRRFGEVGLSNVRSFAFRKLYDTRSALTMQAHGVTELATANVKDFEGLGFPGFGTRLMWGNLNFLPPDNFTKTLDGNLWLP